MIQTPHSNVVVLGGDSKRDVRGWAKSGIWARTELPPRLGSDEGEIAKNDLVGAQNPAGLLAPAGNSSHLVDRSLP